MAERELKPKVAISDDFLDALMGVPRAQRKKVQKFMRNFRRNPMSNGINYEKIENAADANMRSVRIDQAYRAIVLAPETGNVYVMLWVDHHDDAYDWAERRRCVVHPETGSLQVYVVDEQEAQQLEEESEVIEEALFDDWRDRKLRRLGVPDELLPLVRSFKNTQQLEAARDRLPQEAYEALYWLANGDSYEEVHRVVVMSDSQDEVDTEDFDAALEKPASKQRFVVVEDEEELERVFDAALEKWRVFLHPMQQDIVELDVNGPVRVLGGAGTGKTVVAMHRAKYLTEQMYTEAGDQILFTTYTRNLASDIEENLRKLCDPEAMKRIEVVHLDKWVINFLKRQGYPHRIEYYDQYQGELNDLWEAALSLRPNDVDLPRSFYREEWEYVVQALGCASLRDYIRARRTGRGVPLQRATRMQVWPVFEEYRNLLTDRGIRERADAIRDARQILDNEGDILPYRTVIIDEAQDMGAEAFKLIRQIIPEEKPNDLFIVGDGHQRIYRRRVVMKHCGINIVGRNRSHRLRINYRTTDEIRRFAVGLLEDVHIDDLDGGVDGTDHYKSLVHGNPPQVECCGSVEEEIDRVVDFLNVDNEDALKSTCLVARTQKLVERYEQALGERGIPTYRISRQKYDNRSEPGLRVATMHRVKGLEFDRMIVAGVNNGVVPLKSVLSQTEDDAVLEDLEKRERALFYVALTRAKSEALVSCHGKRSPFLAAPN
jgi:superfamily I DNA/RNA helicase/mRNA-degrading endonuclease RelE of RelBE toxin-antitoxin system